MKAHGLILSVAMLVVYRDAFAALLDCAGSPEESGVCAQRWATSIAPLLDDAKADMIQAETYAGYYVANILRRPEPRPAGCAG